MATAQVGRRQTVGRIDYRDLNGRQKENYNYQKVSAELADYGFSTIRLTDDWQGADFIAQRGQELFLKVQLKTRLGFNKKYLGKDLHIAFRHGETCYLYPHDDLLDLLTAGGRVGDSRSWQVEGSYSFPYLGAEVLQLLKPYALGGEVMTI